MSTRTLSKEKINATLQTKWIGRECFYYPTIDSTNTEAKRALQNHARDGSIFVASHQSAGKGRTGKKWISNAGTSIACSILLQPRDIPLSPILLTHLTAAALQLTFSDYFPVKIKWPNDLVFKGKKIAGVLIEAIYSGATLQGIIVGVGVNVFQQGFKESDVNNRASSMDLYSNSLLNPNLIVSDFLSNFESLYEKLLNHNDISFLSICRKNSSVLGKKIFVIQKTTIRLALAEELTDSGELRVRYEDTGKDNLLQTGDVSIRGKDVYK